MARLKIRPVGWVESTLVDREAAPMQADEGAPPAWLLIDPDLRAAMADLEVGSDVILITWLDQADRDVLAVHPRSDPARPIVGVFSTRSPDRPNPIGLHTVRITAIEDNRIQVSNLEAIDGTPIVDIKPILNPVSER